MSRKRIPPKLNVQPQEPSMSRFLYVFTLYTHTHENSYIHERDGVCVSVVTCDFVCVAVWMTVLQAVHSKMEIFCLIDMGLGSSPKIL